MKIAPVMKDFEEFKPLPDGIYPVIITELVNTNDGQPIFTSEKGTQYLRWELHTFQDGTLQEELVDKRLWINTMLNGKGTPITARFIDCIISGYYDKCLKAKEKGDDTLAEFDTLNVVGQKLRVKVSTRVYEGRTQNEISGYYPLG